MRAALTSLVVFAVVIGTAMDRPPARPPLVLGGYRVLAADFHIHSSTWSDGALTPWGLVLEAERQGLEAIAITGHNQVGDSLVGQWFSRLTGGPTVLTGEEILTPTHHVIAVGVHDVVDFRKPLVDQIEDVHRQGGVAIAAHPAKHDGPEFDDAAVRRLDGSEICHPLIYGRAEVQDELERFAARAPLAAIGSSDFHGFGRMGMCRTYVFAHDTGAGAILDAIRAHRTVVYGLGGRVYGDPPLVALAATHPELRERATRDETPGWADWASRFSALVGLVGLVLTGMGRPRL